MDLNQFYKADGTMDYQGFYTYIIKNNLDITGKPKMDIETSETVTAEPVTPVTPVTPANGTKKLFDDIYDVIDTCVSCTDEQKTALTMWVAHTYFTDKLELSPLLVVTSPQPECGKSTTLSVLKRLCKGAQYLSHTTVSSMKRLLDMYKGNNTILIDEVDTFMFNPRTKFEYASILNSGYAKETSRISMSEATSNGSYKPTDFNVWGAKVISGISIGRKLQPATLTRSLVIQLYRKTRDEMKTHYDDIRDDTYESIRERLKGLSETEITFSRDNGIFSQTMMKQMSDRQRDNWRPLLQIAALGGEEWFAKARDTALSLSESEDDVDSDAGVMKNLLEDIRDIIEKEKLGGEIPCSLLTEKLTYEEEMRWRSYNGGKPITTNQVVS